MAEAEALVPRAPGAHAPIPDELNRASGAVLEAAMEVHRHLGPGLIESVYEAALIHELRLRGLQVRQQVPAAVRYKDIEIGGQRIDLLVEPGVIVELKAVEQVLPLHEAQLLSYLRTTGHRVGLLINFNVPLLKRGIRRLVN